MLVPELEEYMNAGFSGVWITTGEPDEAQMEIIKHAHVRKWPVSSWDAARDLVVAGQKSGQDPSAATPVDRCIAAIRASSEFGNGNDHAVFIMHNLHLLFERTQEELIQMLFWRLTEGKARRITYVFLSPCVKIPVELEKLIVVMEHALPTKAELKEVALGIEDVTEKDLEEGVIDAAAGLTRYEAQGAFALSLVRHNKIKASVVTELKAGILKKTGLLSLNRGEETFSSVGGMAALKDFTVKSLVRRKKRKTTPRGVMLLGVSGSGKSAFCKALGNEVNRPTLSADISAVYSKWQGEAEQGMRRILQAADAMSPCILFVDEIEKALSGVGSSGDNGVSDRIFGTMLTWMNDHTSDVYLVCTSNNIAKLPPEFTRAGRFDGVFFLDLPTAAEKDLIWTMYGKEYEVDITNKPNDTDWTGAEIKDCCRQADLLEESITQTARNIVPVAVTAKESVQRLREWATGRVRSAAAPGVYSAEKPGGSPSQPGRRVSRGNSQNN